ncbi:MAG: protein-L-isoaspartate(D-aspartate) O-methyltransferase [Thermodesulfobacteriota bacterium]
MVQHQIAARGIRDQRLLAAMTDIPRHLFMDQALWPRAYEDHPLPIGDGQTISQPYMVAIMTDALGLTGRERVLEIGTGSGYQTAILARLADWVYSIEVIMALSRRAQKVLEQLKIFNVNLKVGDGSKGWPEQAPFEAIIVTAGAPSVPKPLAEQLAEGGRLVVPVGDRGVQTLLRITRRNGKLIQEDLGGCRFVDLVGEYGW